GYDTDASPWARLFFERAEEADANVRGGLRDVTFPRWVNQERPTCGSLQLDHVLATPGIVARIDDTADDPAVIARSESLGTRGSDHNPLRWSFTSAADAMPTEGSRFLCGQPVARAGVPCDLALVTTAVESPETLDTVGHLPTWDR